MTHCHTRLSMAHTCAEHRHRVEQAENRHRDLGTRRRGLLGSGAVASQQDGGGHGLFYAGFAALDVALALAAGSLLQ